MIEFLSEMLTFHAAPPILQFIWTRIFRQMG